MKRLPQPLRRPLQLSPGCATGLRSHLRSSLRLGSYAAPRFAWLQLAPMLLLLGIATLASRSVVLPPGALSMAIWRAARLSLVGCVWNMTSMLDKSGYKDQEQVDFMDFVMQNHADNLSALSHAEQLKILPRLKSDYQDMKVRNANSTNGTSWKNGKRVKTDKLDYEKDAAIDPTGIIDNKIWFGDGSDGKGLGKANIFARKNLPPVFFGADDVDVMDNGQRIMKKDNRGARGPQGSIDMREINRLSLRDAAK